MATKKKRGTRHSGNYHGTAKKHGGGFTLARLDFLLPYLAQPEQPPWRAVPWLLLLAFVLRVAVSLTGDFVIHPDEIMQYLEPAHGLVFGNSVAYWEFYYGARSWLIPSVVALILFLCKILGLTSPAEYIAAVKIFFCLLSLLIPLAMYIVGRRLFGETTARLALLLGVFWYEFVGFAHKPMTEFVATSLLMLLAMLTLRPHALNGRQAIIATLLGVLTIAIRFQYAPVAALLLLVPFIRGENAIRLAMFAAAIAMALLVGLFDYFTWGQFFHSYLLNLKVNFLLNTGRAGESSPFNFIGWLTIASGGVFLLALSALLYNTRRRLFMLLLVLVVLLPHMTQSHREYRFIFVLLPFMLLLFADFLARGWKVLKKSAVTYTGVLQPRSLSGIGYAIVVSALGIANALPWQSWVYEAKSQETGYVHFLRNQDEIFSIYRYLSADDSVRGVKDTTRAYFNTGGYYYLHKPLPFYDGNSVNQPADKIKDYVSHIIATAPIETAGIVRTGDNRLIMRTTSGQALALPAYISDATLNKLVYWDRNGQASTVEGFVIDKQYKKFALWRAEPEVPVRSWRRYRIYPDNEPMYPIIKKVEGKDARQPTKNIGIQFSDSDA